MPSADARTTRPRACEECRQQKIRCDAHPDYSKPCSKCTKAGLECIFTTTFKKRKTRSKGDMQREIDSLRKGQRLADGAEDSSFLQNSLSTPPASGMGQSLTPSSQHGSVGNASTSLYLNPTSTAIPPPPQSKGPATFSPSLDGLEIEPRKLEDCFSLFFKHYHPILPIFDPQQSCRDYFQYSPLLFWTIVITGSRRYVLDPTLLEMLAPKVSDLAALATTRASGYIPTISALLILCVWPLPMENASDDPSPVFVGVIMQLAQQNGLHMLGRRQDFSQSHLIKDTTQDIFLARLWAWCRLICRCVNVYSGLHPHIFEDVFDLEPQSRDILDSTDRSVFWMHRLDSLVSNAQNILMKSKYEQEDVEKPHQLLALINYYDEEVLKIKRQAQGQLAEIWFNCTRLHIGAFHFLILKSPPSKLSSLIKLHHIACAFIDNITSRDQQDDYALYLSEQYYRTLTLAAMVILRICRSAELRSTIDYYLGEQSYFAAIHILKKRVLKNNDLNARMAGMLSQLWLSKRVFRQPDGSMDSLNVCIRSRGGMGVVYDCLWYWRQEFLGQPNPYLEETSNGNKEHQGSSDRLPAANPGPSASVPPPTTIQDHLVALPDSTTTQLPDFDPTGYANLSIDHDAFFSEWNWSTNASLFGDFSQDFEAPSAR